MKCNYLLIDKERALLRDGSFSFVGGGGGGNMQKKKKKALKGGGRGGGGAAKKIKEKGWGVGQNKTRVEKVFN